MFIISKIKQRFFEICTLCTSLLACHSLWFAGLRTPAHDAVGIVLARFWQSALFETGDWPWWFPYSKNGFSWATLHFMAGVTNPIGIFVAFSTKYDIGWFGKELALHDLIGGLGAYAYSRLFITHHLVSCSIAVTYIASGFLSTALTSGTLYAGLMGVPWVFFACHKLVHSSSHQARLFSTGLIALLYSYIVASGYPQTWLLLPIFLLIYIVLIRRYNFFDFLIIFLYLLFCLLIILLILSPWIVETISTPLFGSELRNRIDPDLGAMNLSNLTGAIFVNSAPIFSDAPQYPVYFGLVPCLALFWRICSSVSVHIPHYVRISTAVSATTLIGYAVQNYHELLFITGILLLGFATCTAPRMRWKREELTLLTLIITIIICATINPVGSFLRNNVFPFNISRWSNGYMGIALILMLILSWMYIQSLINYYSLYTISSFHTLSIIPIPRLIIRVIFFITIIFYIYINIFVSINLYTINKLYIITIWLSTFFIAASLQHIKSGATFVIEHGPSTALAFLMGSTPLVMAVTIAVIMSPHKPPSRIHGTTALWTTGVALAVTSIAILVLVNRAYKRRFLVSYNIFILIIFGIIFNILNTIEIFNSTTFLFFAFIFICFVCISYIAKLYLYRTYYCSATMLFSCIFLVSATIPVLFNLNSNNWYSTFSSSKEFYFTILGDGQIFVDFFQVSVFVIIAAFILSKRDKLRASLSMLTIIDMLLATSRYNSGTDWAVSLGEYWDFLLTPRQEISANYTSNLRTRNFDLNSSWYGLNLGFARWPGITPEMETFDNVSSFPDLYNKLIYFSNHYINISSNEVFISTSDLYEQNNDQLLNSFDNSQSITCYTDNKAHALINLLNISSSIVIVNFETACTYLLIYTDRWSKGWTAELNNTPIDTLRINNLFRGVIVPAGAHRLVWKYRPAYWHITSLMFFTGILLVISLLLFNKINILTKYYYKKGTVLFKSLICNY